RRKTGRGRPRRGELAILQDYSVEAGGCLIERGVIRLPRSSHWPCGAEQCAGRRPGGDSEAIRPSGWQRIGDGDDALDHSASLFAHGYKRRPRTGQAVIKRLTHEKIAQRHARFRTSVLGVTLLLRCQRLARIITEARKRITRFFA